MFGVRVLREYILYAPLNALCGEAEGHADVTTAVAEGVAIAAHTTRSNQCIRRENPKPGEHVAGVRHTQDYGQWVSEG
jgi:hypothetical protein